MLLSEFRGFRLNNLTHPSHYSFQIIEVPKEFIPKKLEIQLHLHTIDGVT